MWLIIGAFAAFSATLGVKAFRRTRKARMTILAGVGLSAAVLVLAIGQETQDHPHLAIGLCLAAAGIAWEFYRLAEAITLAAAVKTIRTYIAKMK
jgi:hypothetical protein